jgi:gluconate 2-dehydrogenase gamma chain
MWNWAASAHHNAADEQDASGRDATGASERWQARRISRRDLLKQVGIASAVAATPAGISAAKVTAVPVESAVTARKVSARVRVTFETLTAAETGTLEAIVARLIPSGENGPGATEARAAHYIDRALAGPLASSRPAYAAGLAAVDSYAQASKGAPFAKLPVQYQDAVLSDMEKNVAKGFTPNSSSFFDLVRTHTIQGTFCDPYYGGNANFVGWDLIGYPGTRISVSADEQRMGVTLTPNHKSAYDYAMFSKKRSRHDD